jgi:hypothetical protein
MLRLLKIAFSARSGCPSERVWLCDRGAVALPVLAGLALLALSFGRPSERVWLCDRRAVALPVLARLALLALPFRRPSRAFSNRFLTSTRCNRTSGRRP